MYQIQEKGVKTGNFESKNVGSENFPRSTEKKYSSVSYLRESPRNRERQTINTGKHLARIRESIATFYDDNKEESARVLVAQSEPEILTLIRQFLNSRGTRITAATNGNEAYNKFSERNETNNPFDIVVLDTHLTGKDGLRVAKKIHNKNPKQRIVMLTTTPKHLLDADNKGIDFIHERDILTMPFKLADFASLIGV